MTRPINVVLLITDAQRLDITTGDHGLRSRTPTFDRIAREGVVLDAMRCTSPICSPARASIFTGLDPHVAGMPHIPSVTSETETHAHTARMGITHPSFTQRLRERGYYCYLAGKWHVGEHTVDEAFDEYAANDAYGLDYAAWCRERGYPEGRVFQRPMPNPFRYHKPPGMSLPRAAISDMPDGADWDAWTVRHALDFLDRIDGSRPFMLTCCTRGPHSPFVVPRAYAGLYDPATIPRPGNFHPSPTEPSIMEESYFRAMWRDWGTDWNAWQASAAAYLAYNTYLDELLGGVVRRLETMGVLDRTLVITTSDHGEMLGCHGLAHKFCPYDENLRVPFAMRLPARIPAGAHIALDTTQTDIAPTVFSLLGLEHDPAWSGRDLTPCLRGEPSRPEARDVFAQFNLGPDWGFSGIRPWRLIVRRPWKYIYHLGYGGEMYQLEEDPGEMNNLAGVARFADVERALRAGLFNWMRQTNDPLWERVNIETGTH